MPHDLARPEDDPSRRWDIPSGTGPVAFDRTDPDSRHDRCVAGAVEVPMRRSATIFLLLYLALPATAAFVALFAPDPVPQERISEALQAIEGRNPIAVSPVRLLVALLPVAALAARLMARRGTWR